MALECSFSGANGHSVEALHGVPEGPLAPAISRASHVDWVARGAGATSIDIASTHSGRS